MERILKQSKKFILGYCNCGCKKRIEIRNKQRKINRYISGHNIKFERRHRITEKRICYYCGTSETALNTHGYARWFLNHDSERNVLCCRCYTNLIKNPRKQPEYRTRRYTYANRRLLETSKSRTGICSWCHRKIGDKFVGWRNRIMTIKETHTHHIFYLVICPWFGRVEICAHCHNKETWRERKEILIKAREILTYNF